MSALWTVENNRLTNADLPEPITAVMSEPYPPFWWYVSNGKLTHNGLPVPALVGAFRNCGQLKTAVIPESIKNIGSHAFAETALKSVTIASDCVYSDTSFPSRCTVNFYPSGGE